MLFPLMDMFFILLLFFLVTAGIEQQEQADPGVFYAIPVETTGKVQVLIQMIDRDSILWLDNTCFYSGWKDDFDQRNRTSISPSDLRKKVKRYLEEMGSCVGKEILAIIRCPRDLVYGDVLRLEQNLQSALESSSASLVESEINSNRTTIPQRKITLGLVVGEALDIEPGEIKILRNGKVRINWPD